ncbi:MAG: hypothetical protein Q7J35_15860 [Candidatus Methanoperedens sp.]|nr:hypothetical protein [Candidatus Methanoperedens sp.]
MEGKLKMINFDLFDWNNTSVKLAVYLLYGTSFIIMFLVMALWKHRMSHIELLSDFKYLAIFALLHGLTEYVEIFRILGLEPSWILDLIKLLLATSSFTALLAFGVNVVSAGVEEYRWLRGMPFGALWMYVWMLIFIGIDFTNNNSGINYTVADTAQRYTLGFLGALITTYSFFEISTKIKIIVGEKEQKRFIYVALCFALYTVFGGLLDSDVRILGIPVVVYRTLTAILITLSIIGVFQLFKLKGSPEIKKTDDFYFLRK